MDNQGDHAAEPGKLLVDWRFLLALLALVLNDHWAKAAHPGLLTGKISDVAGLVVLPVLLAAAARSFTRRRFPSEFAPLVFSGGLLIAIKTSAVAAGLVEATLELVTGQSQSIVVDPTDLIGLGGLLIAHQVIQTPSVIRLHRPFRGLIFGVGLLACVATSFDDDSGWTHLEVMEDGTVIASSATNNEGYRSPIGSTDRGQTWGRLPQTTEIERWADDDRPEIDRGPTCLASQPLVCVRTTSADGVSLIEESADGGASWMTVWNVEPGAFWITEKYGYNASIWAGDIVVLDDDSVLVAAAFLEPIRRSPDTGEWTPRVRDVRSIPWQFLLVAGVVALPLFAAVRLLRAGDAEGVIWIGAALLIGICGLVAAGDSVGPGTAVGVLLVLCALFVLTVLAAVRSNKAEPRRASIPIVVLGAAGLLAIVAIPLTLFGQDLLSWSAAIPATVVASLLAPLVAGFLVPPAAPLRQTTPTQLPPPMPSAVLVGAPGQGPLAAPGPLPPPPLASNAIVIAPQRDQAKRARTLWALTPIAVLPAVLVISIAIVSLTSFLVDLNLVIFVGPPVAVGTTAVWIRWVAHTCEHDRRWLGARSVLTALVLVGASGAAWYYSGLMFALIVGAVTSEPLMRIGSPTTRPFVRPSAQRNS